MICYCKLVIITDFKHERDFSALGLTFDRNIKKL